MQNDYTVCFIGLFGFVKDNGIMRILSVVMLVFSLAAAFMHPLHSQPSTDAECPTLVHDALSQLDRVCAGLGRNSICYGNTLVSATFNTEVDDNVFVEPSDQAELKKIEIVQTAPLDEANNIWGLALMNVQANVPGTLPGQGVVYVLMGDAQIENRVDSAALPDPAKAIDLTITTRANIRSAPTTRANILGVVDTDTTLKADIRTEDSEWFRVDYNGLPAWINQVVITSSDEISTLPAPTETGLSPMQAFQFKGGIGETSCSEAFGSLLIQGPDNVVVELEANGVRVKLASTLLLTLTPSTMRFTTLSGAALVEDVIVPRGFSTVTELDAENNPTIFSEPAALTEDEMDALVIFEAIPSGVLHYGIDLDTVQDEEIGDFNSEDNLCALNPLLGMCNDAVDDQQSNGIEDTHNVDDGHQDESEVPEDQTGSGNSGLGRNNRNDDDSDSDDENENDDDDDDDDD